MVGSKQPTPVWLSPEEAEKVRFMTLSQGGALIHGIIIALHCWCFHLEVRLNGWGR